MLGLVEIAVVAAASIGAGLFIFVIFRLCCRQSSSSRKTEDLERANSLQNGIAKLQKNNYYVVSSKPLFSWADHPSLVIEAVENGWSRFAFAASYASFPSARSTRSTLLGSCGAGGKQVEVDISWEVWQGSSEFMQKIRLNSGLKKNNSGYSVVKASLPLPGPPLGNNSFPQEAYFEITILSSKEDDDKVGSRKRNKTEVGEKAKLIQENSKEKKENSESMVHMSKLEEAKLSTSLDDDHKGESISLCLGLTRGGNLPLGLPVPGTFPGSVGFNSDGAVYLDGMKHVLESGKEWGKPGTVLGCGYNPSQRKVYFTVDSELVHLISCKSEEFGSPMYPTLATNVDSTILVNLGQCAFQYAPPNAQRTANPCFLVNSPSIGYEDSKELFSMGRIDSLWHHRSTTRNGTSCASNKKRFDFDDESEGDLFEIVLDSSGKSPNTPGLH